nr:MAG TPA: hypothetical protein [Caudoviricetes sp.]DAY08728.1 MAG TPA: hypothetical protein [Caudoviricetes sp.]
MFSQLYHTGLLNATIFFKIVNFSCSYATNTL